MNTNKIVLIALGGLVMIAGDYLTSYYDAVSIFLLGEVISLGGWTLFVVALEQ